MPVRLTTLGSLLIFCLGVCSLVGQPRASAAAVVATKTAEVSGKEKSKEKLQIPGKRPHQKKTLRVKPPYRLSQIVYRNVVSARTFNKSKELTYSPYYAMEFEFIPAFWFGRYVYMKLDIALTREFTKSYGNILVETTKQGEWILWDTYLEAGVPGRLQIPVLGIEVNPTLRIYVPTSKRSRGRTMILGVRPGVALSRRFNAFRGFTLSYRLWVDKRFYEYTTHSLEEPIVQDPIGSTRSTGSFMNIGRRNTSVILGNHLSLNLAVTKRVGFSLDVVFVHAFLYKIKNEDDRISYEPPGEETNTRYLMKYAGEIYAKPMKGLILAFGFLTENYQLRGDSSYESPFFNRYTTLFLDLRLKIAALSSQLASKRGKQ